MPFPLAHPAGVLPFKRYCQRYLSFPALIIGSLSPDLGYGFGRLHVENFSHRFLAGSFGFCLPAGLLVLLVFYRVRTPAVGILPGRYRQAFLPLCRRPVGAPLSIVVSLLIGAWTHLFLDAITHPDPWLVARLPILERPVLSMGNYWFRVHNLLYAGCTFAGVAWLAVGYLRWLERAAGHPVPIRRGMRWGCALLLASSILYVALASRGVRRSIDNIPAGIIAVLLVIAFLLATGQFFCRTRPTPQSH
jgi:hypothetical protein